MNSPEELRKKKENAFIIVLTFGLTALFVERFRPSWISNFLESLPFIKQKSGRAFVLRMLSFFIIGIVLAGVSWIINLIKLSYYLLLTIIQAFSLLLQAIVHLRFSDDSASSSTTRKKELSEKDDFRSSDSLTAYENDEDWDEVEIPTKLAEKKNALNKDMKDIVVENVANSQNMDDILKNIFKESSVSEQESDWDEDEW